MDRYRATRFQDPKNFCCCLFRLATVLKNVEREDRSNTFSRKKGEMMGVSHNVRVTEDFVLKLDAIRKTSGRPARADVQDKGASLP